MRDPRVEKLAEVLVNYSLRLKRGDLLFISGREVTAPLMRAVYREALAVGAHPVIWAEIEGTDEIFLKHGSEEQLGFVNPLWETIVEQGDALLTIWGGRNTKHLAGVDPKNIAVRRRSGKEVREKFVQRMASGEMRWCGTQFPTHSDAQEAAMSLTEYEDFVYGAGLLDRADPVKEWQRVAERQQRLVERLEQVQELHILTEETDLKVGVAGRRWMNACGRENFPDGEVYTSPHREQVEGRIRFSFPGIYDGREIEDIRLTFREGRIVEATAAKGEELLLALLDTDEGARYLGEVAIGTNDNIRRFTRNMLFDEKIGGTLHLAVGQGFPETGGEGHNTSGVHWDMLADMRRGGRIYADGELIYEDGRFLIG